MNGPSMKNILNQLDNGGDSGSNNIQELDVEDGFESEDVSFSRDIKWINNTPSVSIKGGNSTNQLKSKSGSQKVLSKGDDLKFSNSNFTGGDDSIASAIKNFNEHTTFQNKLKLLKKSSSNNQLSSSKDLNKAVDQKDQIE